MSEHLRLGDLLTRDGQESWPRFIAVNPRMVDKLELVVERIAGTIRKADVDLEVNVHSGYRTPAHNRHVPLAATDSRHQYGDAVDVAIDANGDGRINARDARLVAKAVESVEAQFPDLAGGMGVYTSSRYRQPYVHIECARQPSALARLTMTERGTPNERRVTRSHSPEARNPFG